MKKIYAECRRRLKYWNKSKCAEKVQKITGENKWLLFIDILWCNLRYGTFDEDYIRYEFYKYNERERKRWLTGCLNYYWMLDKLYDQYAIDVFDNKEKFDIIFKDYIKHDILITQKSSETEIRAFISKHKEVIVKPSGGALGIGIYKLSVYETDEINNLIRKIKKGEHLIIEEVIKQHPKMSILNPTSVNTIRVISMLDKKGEPHILNTVAMLGADKGCVSNTHSGGCLCHVDTETGIIDHLGSNVEGDVFLKHPVTNIVLPGYKIPNWDGLCDYVRKLAKVVPSAKYIGWDIVILDDGYDVIEGNIHPGPGHQATDKKGRLKIINQLLK